MSIWDRVVAVEDPVAVGAVDPDSKRRIRLHRSRRGGRIFRVIVCGAVHGETYLDGGGCDYAGGADVCGGCAGAAAAGAGAGDAARGTSSGHGGGAACDGGGGGGGDRAGEGVPLCAAAERELGGIAAEGGG